MQIRPTIVCGNFEFFTNEGSERSVLKLHAAVAILSIEIGRRSSFLVDLKRTKNWKYRISVVNSCIYLYIVFNFDLREGFSMPFSASCCCLRHDEWKHGVVDSQQLRQCTHQEADILTSASKARNTKAARERFAFIAS